MAKRSDKTGVPSIGADTSMRQAPLTPGDLFAEPPSLNLPPRSIVGQSGLDYPEDAPTVMVRNLMALGIDPSVLAATPAPGFVGSHTRPQTPAEPASMERRRAPTPRPMLRPPSADPTSVAVVSPVRVPRPVDVAPLDVPMPDVQEPGPTSGPQWVMIGVIAAVPVLLSLGVAAWILFS
ncbi:MAG: hypothetical protein AB8H79_20395 [Myxococcota bacterium]